MADWHILHLTFEPEITPDALTALCTALETVDYDAPIRALSTAGTTTPSNISERHVGSEMGTLWRSPMISEEQLIVELERVGAKGHGFLIRRLGGGDHFQELAPDCRFTFGGAFPEIKVAGQWETQLRTLNSNVYDAQRTVLEAARAADGSTLIANAKALREHDVTLAAHLAKKPPMFSPKRAEKGTWSSR